MPPLSDLLFFTLTLVGGYGVALLYGSLLRRWPPTTRSLPWLLTISLTILALALIVPAERMGLRAAALVVLIELWFKMGDYTRRFVEQRSLVGTFCRYARFLIPFPVMLVRFGLRERRLPLPSVELTRAILRVASGTLLFGLALSLLHLANDLSLIQSNFLLDHFLKVTLFVLAMESLSLVAVGFERGLGFDTRPLMRLQFLSRSVGEFWCRYNTRVHAWFHDNVYRPAGGRQWPIRSLMLVFFVSGVFHELGFAIATMRIDGYQFLFFMIQAPAILLSYRLNRLAQSFGVLGRIGSHSATLLWIYASSVLFFHGVNRIFPIFYAGPQPLP